MQLLKLFHYIVLLVIQKKCDLLCFFFHLAGFASSHTAESCLLLQMDFVMALLKLPSEQSY
jgi:hypothetical protein